ncbi:YpbS family protein [Metabacillus malikii]|uniref:Ribosomal 50S subunit-associated protein YjgA (DUF615 family) n=1 Tax=Metabacillus malikii TaxID=1504265 RepID=A0ABT9Z9X6_9BACI|nr:YpbS family protein [Metabacillus malikii]MDQ0228825.1 ribosomal 50S subunit-associated protein YjgA (DUF615 family) [Metabacillus malikii]
MGNVHEAISQHSNKQHQHVQSFLKLEARREALIEEAVQLCLNSLPFDVDQINQVTKDMNKLASKGIVPTRKLVTTDMVKDYVSRKYSK